ncbi:hypothetical protein [Nonomuraea rhodomycinica]|uniref:hypothetical protein n=1 Tax=Nonomuraea rhodomycinica TaxID=1712872 RepID=UPI001FE41052|nr:hypothetical protein [Nonomuraea rhodomycinica]
MRRLCLGDLYGLAAPGAAPGAAPRGPAVGAAPRWSPDGTRILDGRPSHRFDDNERILAWLMHWVSGSPN